MSLHVRRMIHSLSLMLICVSCVVAACPAMVKDLLHPSAADEKRKHKLKRLVQSPNSFFMDVKCPGCFNITTVFSHAQVRAFGEPCGVCVL